MFAAHRANRRPEDPTAPLSAWLAANCLRELRGDNHWVLCAAELTTPAWQAVGLDATRAFCELVEAHHEAFIARIDETAGPRWMPAVGVKPA